MFNRKKNRIIELEEWIEQYKFQTELEIAGLKGQKSRHEHLLRSYKGATEGISFSLIVKILKYIRTLDRNILSVRGFSNEELDSIFNTARVQTVSDSKGKSPANLHRS